MGEVWVEELAAVAGEAEVSAEEGLGGGGAEGDDDAWLEEAEFFDEPGAAGGDFGPVGFGVEAAFAAGSGGPFKMFDGVGEVDSGAVDACGVEGFIEEATGGSNEGLTGEVFVVTGLFADEDEGRGGGTLAEDDVCGVAVEGAAVAFLGGFGEGGEGEFAGEEMGSGVGGWAGLGHGASPAWG